MAGAGATAATGAGAAPAGRNGTTSSWRLTSSHGLSRCTGKKGGVSYVELAMDFEITSGRALPAHPEHTLQMIVLVFRFWCRR